MKRIGILTYHRATNYGAVLQAYSLISKLKHDFPNEYIEIIDYSTRAAANDHMKDVIRSAIHGGLRPCEDEIRKNSMFATFSGNLPLSRKKIVADGIKGVTKYINNNYDIVISGSDAVFSWNGKVFPTMYLLGEDSKYVKMSYAASAHRLFYRNAENANISYCKTAFEKYKYIGVRDCETENFVKYCNEKLNTYHNCDPTLLLDMRSISRQTENFDIEKAFGIKTSKPIIIVMTPDAKIGQAITRSFGEKYNILSVFVRNDAVKNHCSILTPFEWATLFKYARVTVTEYFHATILSLLNGTPTVSVDRLALSSGYEGKNCDLLYRRLNLPEFYINADVLKRNTDIIVNNRVNEILEKDFSVRISEALRKEKNTYNSFKEALISIL